MVTFPANADAPSSAAATRRRPPIAAQLALWLGVGSVVTLASAAWVGGLQPAGLALAALGYGFAGGFALWLLGRGFPHATLGAANLVTLGRMALIVSLLAALSGAAEPWVVVAVASVALALDGIDGWLARKHGRVSRFGEILDMEVDSVFTIILAAGAFVAGTVGPVVLLIALPRYLFVATSILLPWLREPLPSSVARKVICVIQMIALIALQVPGVLGILALPLVAAVGATLLWSFGRDVAWLWRSRPSPAVAPV